MKQNLMYNNMNDTIRTSEDYMEAINKGRGIYRFTNLNNSITKKHFSDICSWIYLLIH